MGFYRVAATRRDVSLQVSRAKVLEDAISSRRDRGFERALGRTVRAHGGDYAEYVALISEIREVARRRRLDLWAAARELARQA